MKNKKTLVIWAAAFVVLIAGAAVLYGQLSRDAAPDQLEAADEPQVTEEEGQAQEQEKLKAPDFSVYNASGTLDTRSRVISASRSCSISGPAGAGRARWRCRILKRYTGKGARRFIS